MYCTGLVIEHWQHTDIVWLKSKPERIKLITVETAPLAVLQTSSLSGSHSQYAIHFVQLYWIAINLTSVRAE